MQVEMGDGSSNPDFQNHMDVEDPAEMKIIPEDRTENSCKTSYGIFNTDVQNHIEVENPAGIYISQEDKIKNFFKESQIEDATQFNYGETIDKIKTMLISEPKTWREQLTEIFKMIQLGSFDKDRDDHKNIMMVKVMNQLMWSYKLPFDVVQVTWAQLLKMEASEASRKHAVTDPELQDVLNIGSKSYKEKMIEHIESLDNEQDLSNFKSLQKTIGLYGMSIAGDWAPADQKALFIAWTSNIKFDTDLHKVVETRFVLQNHIESIHMMRHSKIGKDYGDWTQAKLRPHLHHRAAGSLKSPCGVDLILNYIESLGDDWYIEGIGLLDFKLRFYQYEMRTKPYGLELDPCPNLTEARFGETVELQKAVEVLVKREFEKTSSLMRDFLGKIDGTAFTNDRPVLYGFLKYYNFRTGSNVMDEYIRNVLEQFDRKFKR
ncbi:hypothetical protein DFH28DRAFT_1106419 [Melampsora americana]|nr:hypothetical protein DFH28DRAFT_1106419 [Melampsora americana]